MPFNPNAGFNSLNTGSMPQPSMGNASVGGGGGGGGSPFAGLAQFFSDPHNLEQLGQAAKMIAANSGPLSVETANIGGNNILVDNRGGAVKGVAQGLDSLIQMKQQNESMKRRQEFVESVKTVMGSTADNEAKINALMQLEVQHGTDYGLGIKDIQSQYSKNADRSAKKDAITGKKGEAVDKFLGEISSGAYEDTYGVVPIKSEEEARGRAARKYGPDFAKKYPQIEQEIMKKFGPDTFGYKTGEVRTFPKDPGVPYVYAGNDEWVPKKEWDKAQKKKK